MAVPNSFLEKFSVTKGAGALPAEGSACKIIVSDYPEGAVSKSLWIQKDGTYNVIIGEADCDFDYGLEYALTTMTAKEKSIIELACDSISFKITIELLEFTEPISLFNLSNSEKLALGQKHKLVGNSLSADSKFREAFFRFRRSIKYVISAKGDDGIFEEVNTLYTAVCNNMALCQLKVGNNEYVVTLCDKVLNVSPTNVKALLRRSSAFVELKLFDKAADDLKKIIVLDPSNKLAIASLNKVKKELEKQEKSYVDMVRRMCSFN